MKWVKKITFFGLIGLVGIQFIPSKRNQSDLILQSDFIQVYSPPDTVAQLLKIACYDCHSNNTQYPWYSTIQPMAFLMENHIKNGKSELNFNEFETYSERRKRNKLKSIISQIKKEEMPLQTYKLMHRDAVFTNAETTIILDWFEKLNLKRNIK